MPITGPWNYNTTATLNIDITGVDIDEDCDPSGINNAIRALMAELRKLINDQGGKIVSGGSADAQTLTTESSLTAYADGQIIAWIAGFTNLTVAPTLSINGIAAAAIRKGADQAPAIGDIQAGMLCITAYDASANAAAGAWMLANTSLVSDATLAALAALNADAGLLVQTGADAFTKRTLGAGAGILITNPAGTAGAPSIAVDKASAANIRAAAADKVITSDGIELATAAVALTPGSSIAIDWDAAINATLTTDQNCTIAAPTNGQPGTWRTIQITNGASHTVAYNAVFKFPGGIAPVVAVSGGISRLSVFCRSTTIFEVYAIGIGLA